MRKRITTLAHGASLQYAEHYLRKALHHTHRIDLRWTYSCPKKGVHYNAGNPCSVGNMATAANKSTATTATTASNPSIAANKSTAATTPATPIATPATPVSHPVSGKEVFECDSLKMTLVRKIQSYCGDTASRDGDVRSPKSVNFHPDGEKFYIHSLEGMKSVVYGFPEIEKLGTISHSFSSADKSIWAPESGLYLFNDQFKDTFTFSGKPVESTFSHGVTGIRKYSEIGNGSAAKTETRMQ